MPDQISENWETIKYALGESLPPISLKSPETMNNILIKLMSGDMICWISYDKDDNSINGLVITTIVIDDCSEIKNLLIYAIYAYNQTKGIDWMDGYESLRKYAKSRDCNSIIGYTKNEKIIKIAEKFNFDSTYRFISFPV